MDFERRRHRREKIGRVRRTLSARPRRPRNRRIAFTVNQDRSRNVLRQFESRAPWSAHPLLEPSHPGDSLLSDIVCSFTGSPPGSSSPLTAAATSCREQRGFTQVIVDAVQKETVLFTLLWLLLLLGGGGGGGCWYSREDWMDGVALGLCGVVYFFWGGRGGRMVWCCC